MVKICGKRAYTFGSGSGSGSGSGWDGDRGQGQSQGLGVYSELEQGGGVRVGPGLRVESVRGEHESRTVADCDVGQDLGMSLGSRS